MTPTCAACGFTNTPEAAYCGRCGTAIGPICSSCGAGPLDSDLAFCTACGEQLRRRVDATERKVVSVLFVDLVGFTGLSERLDPEDVRHFLEPYYEAARTQLTRYDGTVEKFIGDAVMALFGAPIAHEDDPERAVRAAHAVCEAVRRLRTERDLPDLHVRVGITTGEAIVSLGARPEEGEAMAHGDVVNTAARLQASAPVDGVLVDERTYRATRLQIDFQPAPPVDARGKAAPVPVWQVVAPRARLGIDRFRRSLRLVDRRRELDLMTGALETATTERRPGLVVLAGPPGIGKSRLVWELFGRVDEASGLFFWRQGRCLPYGDGVTFWALAEIVKAQAGILATDSTALVREKLRIAADDLLGGENDARWVEVHLAPLAGLAGMRDLRGDRRAEAFAAWRRFLEAIAARRPLVLVFEDLHWADDGLLDFLADHLGDRFDGPLLVLATCRPELLERRSDWTSGRSSTTVLELEPLEDGDAGRLVDDLLAGPRVSRELRESLVARNGGNPLYAEEYVRMLVERGLLEEAEGSWRLAAGELPLPESVQAIIAARLDGLPAEEKVLVQDAAVIGTRFWLGALAALGDRPRWSAEHHLHDLERKQLVRRERDSIAQGEPQFAFSHGVVRDVAYGQIPRSLRAGKHRRAARWIESLSVDRSEDRSEMLVHHYTSALRYGTASGQETDDLLQPTRLALRKVGDRALGLNAFEKAARFYADALELWPADAADRADLVFGLGRARLHAESGGEDLLAQARDAFLEQGRLEPAAEALVLIGELLWMRGDPEALAHLQRAADLLDDAPTSVAKAFVVANLARFLFIYSDHEQAIERGLEALALSDELGSTELRAHALDTIGIARARTGDPQGIVNLEASIGLAVATNSLESVRGYANLGNALVEAGDLERAFALHEQGRTAAQRFGDAEHMRWFDAERIYEHYWRGSWPAAVKLADRIVLDVETGQPTALEQDALLIRSRIRLARGDARGALADSARALELGRRAGYPEMLVPALALRIRVLESTGGAAEAGTLTDELLGEWPDRCPTSYWLADAALALVALGRGERLLAGLRSARTTSRWLEAAELIAAGRPGEAARVYAEIGSVPDEAIARLRAGRTDAEELTRALESLRAIGATAYVEQGEALFPVGGRG